MKISILSILCLFSLSTFASKKCSSELEYSLNSIAGSEAVVERSVYLGDANLNQVDGRRGSNLSTYSVLADVNGSKTLFLAVINTVECDVITVVEVGPRI